MLISEVERFWVEVLDGDMFGGVSLVLDLLVSGLLCDLQQRTVRMLSIWRIM